MATRRTRATRQVAPLHLELLEDRRVLSTVAYYRFEEGSVGSPAEGTSTVLDSSGNGLTATAILSPLYSSNVKESPVPQTGQPNILSLAFDGARQRVAIPDYPALQITHSLTLEASINLRGISGSTGWGHYVIFRGDDRTGLDPYSLAVDKSSTGEYRVAFKVTQSDGYSAAVIAPISLNTWTHVAGTLDDTTGSMCLYVNGILVRQITTPIRPFGTLTGPVPGLGIGGLQSNWNINQGFDGFIDEVRISDTALMPGSFLSSLSIGTPTAPTNTIGTPGNGKVTLTWQAPSGNGGTPITDYLIQYSENGGVSWIPFADGTSTSPNATVSGLTNGVPYAFRVAAVNAAGTGQWSSTTEAVPRTTPDAPSRLTGSPLNAGVTLTWEPPASDGGSPITGYHVEFRSENSSQWSTFGTFPASYSTVTVTSLTNDTPYAFRLSAVNTAGQGATREADWLITPSPYPASWAVGYGNQDNDQTGQSALLSDGSILFTGTYRGVLSLGSFVMPQSTQSAYAARMRPDGTIAWAIPIATNGVSRGIGMSALADGSSIVAGIFWKTVTIGSRSYTSGGGGLPNIYVARLDKVGNVLWSNAITCDASVIQYYARGVLVAAQPDGSAVVAAKLSRPGRTITFGTDFSQSTSQSLVVAKTDPTGHFLWATGESGRSLGLEVNGLTSLSDGSSVLTGAYWTPDSGFGFGTHTLSKPSDTGGGNQCFVARLSPNGNWDWATSASSPASSDAYGMSVAANSSGVLYVTGWFSGTVDFGKGPLIAAGARDVFVMAMGEQGSVKWSKQCGGIGNDYGLAVSATPDGDAVVVGNISGAAAFGDFTATAPEGAAASPHFGTGAFAARLSAMGTFMFARAFTATAGITPTAVGVSSSGSVITLGAFSGTLSAGPFLLKSVGGSDAFVLAFAQSGTLALVPSAPILEVTEPRDRGLAIRWKPPVSFGGSPVTGYLIQWSSNEGRSWTSGEIVPASAVTTTVMGLENGTSYTVRVAAVNVAGKSGWSSQSGSVKPGRAPSAPSGLTASPGNSSVTLNWWQPSDIGGSPLSDYSVQYSTDAGRTWTPFPHSPTTTTSAKVTGLANGTAYMFRVAAVNASGPGEYFALPTACRPTDNTNFRYTVLSSGIRINQYVGTAPDVSVPQTIDGTPVIAIGPGAFQGRGDITSVTLPQGLLTIGNNAFDGCGNLTSVNIPTGVTSIGDTTFIWCGKLTTLDIPASVSSIGIFWSFWGCGSLRSINVDSGNTKYASHNGILYNKDKTWLYWCPGGKSGDVTLAPTTRTLGYHSFQDCRGITSLVLPASIALIEDGVFNHCTSLLSFYFLGNAPAVKAAFDPAVPSTAYYVRGTTGWGATLGGVPTATTPRAPSSVAAVPVNGSAALSWTMPTDNGGAPVTAYSIQLSSDSGTNWSHAAATTSTATQWKVSGLTNGTAYLFRVAAGNRAGVGEWSSPSAPVTPKPVPYAPTTLIGAPGNGQVALTWALPTVSGDSPVSDYVVQSSSDNGATWKPFSDGVSTRTSATVTGLTNGIPHLFRVAAVNALGMGDWSSNSNPVTPRTTPTAPTVVRGTPFDRRVGLSWVAPSSDGGAAISDYLLQFSANRGKTWTVFKDGISSNTSTEVTGLSNGTAYLFRTAAANAAGTGGWSVASLAIVPRTTPDAPIRLAGAVDNGKVSLNWKAPAINGGAAVTDYVVQFSANKGATWTTFTDGVSTGVKATVTGLTNGMTYVFRVAAVNAAGTGAWSSVSAALTPRTTPGSPTGLTATTDGARISLNWVAPSFDGGAAVTDYVIQYSLDNGKIWRLFGDRASPTPGATLTRFVRGSAYLFRVAAVNIAGTGTWSIVSSPVAT